MPIDLVLTRIRIENYPIHNLCLLSCSAGYLSTGLSTRHRYCTVGVQYRLSRYPIAGSRLTANISSTPTPMSIGLTPVFKNTGDELPTASKEYPIAKARGEEDIAVLVQKSESGASGSSLVRLDIPCWLLDIESSQWTVFTTPLSRTIQDRTF